jgi:hypothetical protein
MRAEPAALPGSFTLGFGAGDERKLAAPAIPRMTERSDSVNLLRSRSV